MKCRYTLQFAVVTLGVSTLFPISRAEAGPSTSPSARQAARLKHRPPAGWIRHYLPDDRYKIMGGTWKYVSTELDRFYYPAWAPEMLRQSPNRVIGFASAEDAAEAGYLPASGYANIHPGFDREAALRATASRMPATRVTLSDGRSTALLPAGWKHTKQTQAQGGVKAHTDMFMTPDMKGMAMVASFNVPNVPGGQDVGAMLRSGNINSLLQNANATGPINNRMSNAINNVTTRPATLGGLRGISIRPKNMAQAGMPRNAKTDMIMVGRGSTVYMFFGGYEGRAPAGYSSIMKSLQLR